MARLFPFSFVLLLPLLVAAASALVEVDLRECSSQTQMASCSQFFTDEALQLEKQWEEAFPQCCSELKNISEQCRCQAINQVVSDNVEVQKLEEGAHKTQILGIAQGLPVLCDVSNAGYCEINQLQQQ